MSRGEQDLKNKKKTVRVRQLFTEIPSDCVICIRSICFQCQSEHQDVYFKGLFFLQQGWTNRNSTFQCDLIQLAPTVKLYELFWEYIVLDVQVLLVLWKDNVR